LFFKGVCVYSPLLLLVPTSNPPCTMSGFGSRLGHKSWKGAVSASNYKGRIRLRWRYMGARYSLSLSYWCDLNLLEAQKVALQIEQDMIVGTFDPTLLLHYAPHSMLDAPPAFGLQPNDHQHPFGKFARQGLGAI